MFSLFLAIGHIGMALITVLFYALLGAGSLAFAGLSSLSSLVSRIGTK